MSRAPVVRLPSAFRASEVKKFIEDDDGFQLLKDEFDSTSRSVVHSCHHPRFIIGLRHGLYKVIKYVVAGWKIIFYSVILFQSGKR